MNVRLITTMALAGLVMSTVACGHSKHRSSSSPSVPAVAKVNKVDAPADCSGLVGFWQAKSPIGDISSFSISNGDNGLGFTTKGSQIYALDGKSNQFNASVSPESQISTFSFSGSCVANNLLVIDIRDLNQDPVVTQIAGDSTAKIKVSTTVATRYAIQIDANSGAASITRAQVNYVETSDPRSGTTAAYDESSLKPVDSQPLGQALTDSTVMTIGDSRSN